MRMASAIPFRGRITFSRPRFLRFSALLSVHQEIMESGRNTARSSWMAGVNKGTRMDTNGHGYTRISSIVTNPAQSLRIRIFAAALASY